MNKEKGLRHLLIALPKLDKSAVLFIEYLNNGNKLSWDKFIIQGTFFIHFSQIISEGLLAKRSIDTLKKCLKKHEDMLDYCDYTPDSRENQEVTLEIIYNIKKEIAKMVNDLAKDTNLEQFEGKFKSEYPESYSLLQISR